MRLDLTAPLPAWAAITPRRLPLRISGEPVCARRDSEIDSEFARPRGTSLSPARISPYEVLSGKCRSGQSIVMPRSGGWVGNGMTFWAGGSNSHHRSSANIEGLSYPYSNQITNIANIESRTYPAKENRKALFQEVCARTIIPLTMASRDPGQVPTGTNVSNRLVPTVPSLNETRNIFIPAHRPVSLQCRGESEVYNQLRPKRSYEEFFDNSLTMS